MKSTPNIRLPEISRLSITHCAEVANYSLAADYFMGESVVKQAVVARFWLIHPIEQQLKPEYSGLDQWIDLAD